MNMFFCIYVYSSPSASCFLLNCLFRVHDFHQEFFHLARFLAFAEEQHREWEKIFKLEMIFLC